jgi:multiple RNA-binding domain-containing protein 1
MPPSHSLALIEFGSSNDAKSAYRNLAYKQFKDAPLFLEWAPTGVFGKKDAMERVKPVEDAKPVATPAAAPQKAAEKPKKPTGPTAEELKKQEEEAKKKKELEAMEEEVEAQDESAGQDTTNTTLYVKNLNFATMEETLKRTVERLVGAVRSVTIAKHKVKDQVRTFFFKLRNLKL